MSPFIEHFTIDPFPISDVKIFIPEVPGEHDTPLGKIVYNRKLIDTHAKGPSVILVSLSGLPESAKALKISVSPKTGIGSGKIGSDHEYKVTYSTDELQILNIQR